MGNEVKQHKRGATRVSSKNQVTLPVAVLREAGLHAGDSVRVHAVGPGEIRLVDARNRLDRYAGALTGTYPKGYLRKLRSGWR